MKIFTSCFALFVCASFSQSAVAQTPNFSENIAAIIYENCTGCHRPGEIGPFSLITYEDVSSNAFAIQAAVVGKVMPPWPANPDYRHYKDELVLEQSEIDLIDQWVMAGSPEGDSTLTPSLPDYPDGSQLGVPDSIYLWPEPLVTLGNNKNTYREIVIATNLTEDRYIRGIEFRPDQSGYIHHADFFQDTTGTAKELDDLDPGVGFDPDTAPFWYPMNDMLFNWSPGMVSQLWPEGMGKILRKNAHIVIDIHYAPTATPITDQSSINIFFSDDSVRVIMLKDLIGAVTNMSNFIPANEVKTFYCKRDFDKDKSLMSVSPHMHLLGDAMKTFVVTPTNDTIPIIDCDYDFHWQYMYTFHYLIKIPAGSTAYTTAVFDNTINNPDNPHSPPQDVYWGGKTEDEMLIHFTQELEYMPGDENFLLDSSLISIPTGISATAIENFNLQAYPNPASDKLMLILTNPGNELVNITIRDAVGKIVKHHQRQLHSNSMVQVTLGIGDLSPGVYVVTATTESKQATVKVIKE